MLKNSLILFASLMVAAAAGCSSSSDSGGAGGGPQAPYVPKTNGVAMNEQDACESLVDAVSKAAGKLQCVVTVPACPNYIQSSGAPVCSQYDEGSVLGCADFYATFTSCADFNNRPCEIHNIAGSAPNGCPADAGADAQPDAADTDAQDTDAGAPDAEPDTDTDAAAVDAESAD